MLLVVLSSTFSVVSELRLACDPCVSLLMSSSLLYLNESKLLALLIRTHPQVRDHSFWKLAPVFSEVDEVRGSVSPQGAAL